MKTLPIRLRLTLWYFFFISISAITISCTSWILLQRSIVVAANDSLGERIADIQILIAEQPIDSSREKLREVLFKIYRHKDEGKWLQVIDDQGHWLYRSSRKSLHDPLPDLTDEPASIFRFKPEPGHHLRQFSRAFTANGRTYQACAAVSADQPDVTLEDFKHALLILVPLSILLAIIPGHLLGRKALGPVAAIATQARLINDRNLSSRLPIEHSGDEIEHLSITLNQMLERIHVAFQSVRSFTADASHELRTPLALLSTRIDLALCFPRTNAHYKDVLRSLQTDVARMLTLTDSLLALARAGAGAEKPELQPIHLSELAAETIQEWGGHASKLGLSLTSQVNCDDVLVLGDKTLLLRLLRILIENACRFTPTGGSIELGVHASAHSVLLSVQDSGIGIGEEHLPHIFERFYRVRDASGRQPGGSGLGLSLAKWIAEQHGTEIKVGSSLGHGSWFSVNFPILNEDAVLLPKAAATSAGSMTPSDGIVHPPKRTWDHLKGYSLSRDSQFKRRA